MARFVNKVALVTGSSNGIGRATAVIFAHEGAKITITGRDSEALKVTKLECLKAGAKENDILDLLGDITKEEVQNKLVDETVKKFGKIDVLINNHGGALKERDASGNFDLNAFDAVMDLNCKSALAMTTKALPHLLKTKGCVVNVSSTASTIASVPSAYYAMAKVALDHQTRILAAKYAKDGVRVNCINPGFVKTTFLDKVGLSHEHQAKMREALEETGIPCGRFATPEDIAKPIAFLADNDAAAYITGQTLIADGGLVLYHGGFENPKYTSLRHAKA